jgi:hypothetical protein
MDIEKILDFIIKEKKYAVIVGKYHITHIGLKEDTHGKRDVFEIKRWYE